MNVNDKKVILQQITSILDPCISNWSVIQVQQFLEIINCGLFSKIVRAFGINGQMLLESSKIQSLFLPQLKPSTTLLFQKLMFIIDELKPVKYNSAFRRLRSNKRQARSPVYITDNLMKMFGMGVDLVKQKNIVLWTTEDLLTFISVIGYSTFDKVARETNCDGFMMLYVVSDETRNNRTFKTLKSQEISEFKYISQILLAQHFMQKSKEEQEEVKQAPLRRRLHSEAIIEVKDNNSQQQRNIESPQNLNIIPETLSNQNSPTNSLTKPSQQKLILESIQNLQKQKESENHKSNSGGSGGGSAGNSLNQSRNIRGQSGEGKNSFSLNQNRQLVFDNIESNHPISRSYYPESIKDIVFAKSYLSDHAKLQKQKEKEKQTEWQFELSIQQQSEQKIQQQKQKVSQPETPKNQIQFKFAKSYYSSLDGSGGNKIIEIIQEASEIDFQMVEESSTNNNQKQQYEEKQQKSKVQDLQSKQYHQKQKQILPQNQVQRQQQGQQKQQQKGFALATSYFISQSIKSIKLPQAKQKHNNFLQKIKKKHLQQQMQNKINRIAELSAASFSLPFNLMTFKSLNSITLGEIRFSLQTNNQKKLQQSLSLLVNGQQTFGVNGCKFGRHPTSDYCYPDQFSISTRHAMIFFINNQFYIQDLGSKIGTFKQIQQIQIYSGLTIQLSFQLQMTFEVIKKNNLQHELRITFDDLKKEQNQAQITLNKQSYKIGRAPNCQIPINSNYLTISANHAKIFYSNFNNRFYFKDTKSRYGSWLRLSKKEIKSQLFLVEKGDRIRISSKKIFQVFDVEITETFKN